jgi:SAM-dependent methyltransferase
MNWNAEFYNHFDTEAPHIRDFLFALCQLYVLPTNLSVLDVGCGTGRLLSLLATLGWRVTGLEPNADYYAAARQFASESIQLKQGGFADIDENEAYHLVAAVNAPFAYLLDMPSRQDALNRIFRALKPNGLIFLDVPNFLWRLRYFSQPQDSFIQTPIGETLRRVTRYDVNWHHSIFRHTDTFYRNGIEQATQVHEMGILDLQSHYWLLEQAGFKDIRSYNSYAKPKPERIRQGRILLSAQKLL